MHISKSTFKRKDLLNITYVIFKPQKRVFCLSKGDFGSKKEYINYDTGDSEIPFGGAVEDIIAIIEIIASFLGSDFEQVRVVDPDLTVWCRVEKSTPP